MSGTRRVTEVPPGLPSGAAADLVEEVLVLGGRETRLLRPRSGDALLDEVLAEEDPADDRLPFWAELWPSGSALAAVVAAEPLAGSRVLELGSGLGLVSVAAALAGADVLAADQSPEAVAFTTVNARRNDVPVRVLRCTFEQPEALLAEAPYDLVVAADVIYEPKTVPVLVDLLPRLVGPGGRVWLADPGRPREDDFLRRVDRAGWHRDTELVTPPDTLPRVRIHKLTR
ncbi:MAG TPA: methyltransferase domain-containing protein [Mycobacteriales bacterium]